MERGDCIEENLYQIDRKESPHFPVCTCKEEKQTVERPLYLDEIIWIDQSEWYFEKEKVYVYDL